MNFPYKRVNHFSESMDAHNNVWKLPEIEFKLIEEQLVCEECIMNTKKLRIRDLINRYSVVLAMKQIYGDKFPKSKETIMVDVLKIRRDRRNEIKDIKVACALSLREYIKTNYPNRCNAKDIGVTIASKIPYDLWDLKYKYIVTEEDMRVLKSAFMKVSDAHDTLNSSKLNRRRNFFSHKYVFYKLSQQFWNTKYIAPNPYRSGLKLDQNDKEWKEVCNYLGWLFIPSEGKPSSVPPTFEL